MESNLSGDIANQEIIETAEVNEDGWETLELPGDDETDDMVIEASNFQPISDDDERAELDAELARIDASWQHRSEPETASDSALKDLESKLSDLDI